MLMKISVICRTRNEQKNIERFCSSYDWADEIIVSDCGSIDGTVEIAKKFPNVRIKMFWERISKDGFQTWRTPHGRQINFMAHLAEEGGADWIIFDDADCFPNSLLKRDCRSILERVPSNLPLVRANRIYMLGTDRYFHEITLPNKTWEASTSLYAWRANHGIYADESDPWSHYFDGITNDRCFDILPPYCLLHDYYPDDGMRKKKLEFYKVVGEQEIVRDPLEYSHDIDKLEDWMI